MSWTLGEVRARVRSLVDDPQGSYVTNDFVDPLINEVYADCNSQITSTQSQYDIGVVEIPSISPGTPNLSQWQAPGELIGHLAAQPIRIDWKTAGLDESYYQLVQNYEVIPDVQPQQGVSGWEYRSNIIWITRCSIEVDLRIRAEFGFPPLSKDSDVLLSHPRIGYVVAYGAAALIANVRGNQPWIQSYESKAEEGLEEIMGQLVRSEQGQVRRIGRQTGRGNWSWNVPNATQ